jgi:hypothetical protein
MYVALRILALIIIVPSVYYFIFWVPFSLIDLGEHYWIKALFSLLIASLSGWFIWTTSKQESGKGLIPSIFMGALLIGGIGFFGGFFGPIIFAPEANQGPLLGLFITGPIGFVLGGFLGLIYWLVKLRHVNTK